jgi:hypothetical protein
MFGQGFTFFSNGQGVSRGVSYDSDAQAFFTRNSTLTDVTTKNAINQFVLDLKSNSLWSLGKYMYFGFLGDSTKFSHNLFSSSFQLTVSSGWTFDSQGAQGNGTSAYANTGFNASANASQDSKTLFVTSQTNSDQLGADLGADNTTSMDILLPRFSGNCYGRLSINGWQTIANTNSLGNVIFTRTTSTETKLYVNGSYIGVNTSASTGQPSVNDFLGCYNGNGSPTWYSSRKISIYGRMDGLDSTKQANLNTAINTLCTTLGIKTW